MSGKTTKKPTDRQRIRSLEVDVKKPLIAVGIQARQIAYLQEGRWASCVDPLSMT